MIGRRCAGADEPSDAPEPWEGRACGECRHCEACAMLGGWTARVCALDGRGIEEVDPGAPACECFED